MKTTTNEILALQPHLFSGMKVLKGKQQDMITTGIASLEHPVVDPLFPSTPNDNTFRQHRGILKPHVQKQNHLKDRAIKHMRI
jgi:hypothetical protein